MATGIPELGMPPLDPIHLELIDFKFFNMTIEFVDVDMEGFKTFTLEKSTVDRTGRSWDIELSIPRVEAEGVYRMSGSIPPNLDLGFSTGDERFSADGVYITASIKLGEWRQSGRQGSGSHGEASGCPHRDGVSLPEKWKMLPEKVPKVLQLSSLKNCA